MYIYLFVIGIILGSFYNVIGIRLPNKESVVHPRSHCSVCKRTLRPLELIPVISYIFLKGKCQTCRTTISPIYPGIELLTGFLFLLSYYHFGFSVELIVSLLFISLLVIVTVSDLTSYLILDKVLILFAVPILLLRLTVAPLDPFWSALLGAFIGFSLLLLIAIVSKGGMGGGDIKLYAVIGLVLGIQNTLLSLFFAAFTGAIVGLIGMLVKNWGRKTALPFGPYIAIGSLVAYFYGDYLWQTYLQLFY
ncbi:prepilin peptidase [Bacillus shivajii]|uniref:prepilin peptidase n=1 Tax=Bacillus shivajii TaxID=1983719 RepID=UPI001CFAA1AA|nr:A24 family peptidase [Bacillus shivajii]UCZ52096.1 prepilin peptidase [Bacillus shivajii]